MAKIVKFGADAKKALKEGIDIAANSAKVTIGAKGRNALFDRPNFGQMVITNDGKSIVNEIDLEDEFQDAGAKMVKEVGNKADMGGGDGTTTAVVLMQAITTEGLDAETNGIEVKKQLEKALEKTVEIIEAGVRTIKDDKELAHVAAVSAENVEHGKMIAKLVKEVGPDGLVTVEESQGREIEIEKSKGYIIDRGWKSPWFANNEKGEAVLRNPLVLVYDGKLNGVLPLKTLLDKILSQSARRDIAIVCDEVHPDVLQFVIANKMQNVLNPVLIQAPEFGDRRKDALQDLATILDTEVVSEEKGMLLEEIDHKYLGRCDKLIVSKEQSAFIGPKGDAKARIAQIKAEAEKASDQYTKDKAKERIAKLSGGVATIKVGAATEQDMRYTKLKLEDAVNATKAALEQGVVEGGGIAYFRASQALKGDDVGTKIMRKALQAPLRQILTNAGAEVDDVLRQIEKKGGYDVKAEKVVDMWEAGILDAFKIVRNSLEVAVSVSGVFLTVEVASLVKRERPAKE